MGLIGRLISLILPSPPEIGPDEDVLFVDVRTRREYDRGHVRGAIHIPHGEMERRWREVAKRADDGGGEGQGRRILIYCLSGSRSAAATRVLQARGVEGVENAGGIGGLKRAGVEIER